MEQRWFQINKEMYQYLKLLIPIIILVGCNQEVVVSKEVSIHTEDISSVDVSNEIHQFHIDSLAKMINLEDSFVNLLSPCFEKEIIYSSDILIEEKPIITEVLRVVKNKEYLLRVNEMLKRDSLLDCDMEDPVFGRPSKGLSTFEKISNVLDSVILNLD